MLRKLLRACFGTARPVTGRPAGRNGARPCLEGLEERCQPSRTPFGPLTDVVTAHDLRLQRDGDVVELLDNGVVVDSRPVADATSAFIAGAPGAVNTLTVDNRGGLLDLPDGITFSAAGGGANTLIVLGSPEDDVVTVQDGLVSVNGTQHISFSNVGKVLTIGD